MSSTPIFDYINGKIRITIQNAGYSATHYLNPFFQNNIICWAKEAIKRYNLPFEVGEKFIVGIDGLNVTGIDQHTIFLEGRELSDIEYFIKNLQTWQC